MAQRQLFCRTRQSRVRSSPQCTGPTLWYAPGTLLTLDRRRKVSCAVGRAQLPPRFKHFPATGMTKITQRGWPRSKAFLLRKKNASPCDGARSTRPMSEHSHWAQTSPRLQLVGMTFLFESSTSWQLPHIS